MFKCDTHVHTNESSVCGKIPAKDIVHLYKNAGFDTIFITDHFDYRYIDTNAPDFEKVVYEYTLGYRIAKEEGKKIGLTVLFGAEIMLKENKNHYLLYGLTPEFLAKRRDIFDMNIQELHEYAKSNGIFLVQAHPYRDEVNTPMPNDVDAIEVYNSHPRHRNYNEKALAIALEHDKLQTAGSDAHQLPDVGLTGVLTKNKITSPLDYINAVKNKEITIIK